MNVLSNVLPGVRELRAPAVAGYLWLLFAWLVAQPDVGTTPNTRLGAPMHELLVTLSPVGVAVAASFVAYLIGAASQAATRVALGALRTRLDKTRGRRSSLSLQTRVLDGEVPSAPSAASEYLRGHVALEGLGLGSTVMADLLRELERAASSAESESDRELLLPATLLVGERPELFAEVDRLKAEGELRVTVAPPLVALSILGAVAGSPWWLAGTVLAIVLLVDGLDRERKSRGVIRDARDRGLFESPSLKRLEAEVDAIVDRAKGVAPTYPRVS